VDINSKNIFVLNPHTQQHETISLPEMIGAVSLTRFYRVAAVDGVHCDRAAGHLIPCVTFQVMPTTQHNVVLAALERDLALIDYADPSSPQISVIATTPEADGLPADGWRFNDAKVAPGGTVIAGR
jgi:sugar lactone lactonase YvrE